MVSCPLLLGALDTCRSYPSVIQSVAVDSDCILAAPFAHGSEGAAPSSSMILPVKRRAALHSGISAVPSRPMSAACREGRALQAQDILGSLANPWSGVEPLCGPRSSKVQESPSWRKPTLWPDDATWCGLEGSQRCAVHSVDGQLVLVLSPFPPFQEMSDASSRVPWTIADWRFLAAAGGTPY